MFSSRVPRDLTSNRLAVATAAHQASGRRLLDLTVTNPTVVGFSYPEDLLAPLAGTGGLAYRPEPFGLPAARRAVAEDYARRGISVAEDRVVLTASTSEAYSVLFKLLCEPAGDDVLVPVPSYPLFDHLTRLDGVTCTAYALEYHGRWELDERSVDREWRDTTRAVLAVSPNNPTGSVLSPAELDALSTRCAERDAALIIDEVFADYLFDSPSPPAPRTAQPGSRTPDRAPRTAHPAPRTADRAPRTPDPGPRTSHPGPRTPDPGPRTPDRAPRTPPPGCLTFRLGGLSKSAGLPQVKLGWIAVDGPDTLVRAALQRLELICDTYLSVSTPVQVAAPVLIERGAEIREQIRTRIAANLTCLRRAAAADPALELLNADGGWTAVLRVPARGSEEDLVIDLLESRDTLAHPGFFFDFPHEAFLVLSLLPDPGVFAEGTDRILEHLRG
ncbi:MAG TPA: aminotransferase class I/II-fold pyridoxal phosphate-dependent enzyme [Vicinamibacterales bacterium]